MFKTIPKLKPLVDKNKNLESILGSATYLTASASDYLLTVSNISKHEEGNSIIHQYLPYLGNEYGILVPKVIIATSLLIGLKAIDLAYRNNKTKIKSKYIAYPGAVLTALAGLSWLLIK